MLHRRSVRLPVFDYRTPGAYFITLCTRDRAPLFGRIVEDIVHLSEIGCLVEAEWHRTAELRSYVRLDAFVVMPDHVHGVLWIAEGAMPDADVPGGMPDTHMPRSDVRSRDVPRHVPTPPRARSLSHIINGFKGAVTRQARHRGIVHDVWQRGFYEHVVRHEHDLARIRRYIAENPVRWANQV